MPTEFSKTIELDKQPDGRVVFCTLEGFASTDVIIDGLRTVHSRIMEVLTKGMVAGVFVTKTESGGCLIKYGMHFNLLYIPYKALKAINDIFCVTVEAVALDGRMMNSPFPLAISSTCAPGLSFKSTTNRSSFFTLVGLQRMCCRWVISKNFHLSTSESPFLSAA